MSELRISEDLALPITVARDSMAIIARKGQGKTYAASVLAEEMLDRGIPIAVLDPMGAWWGLRSPAEGKKGGYPVVIMGGDYADVPLEPTAGKVVADFILEERVPTIVDLSLFESRADEVRFATAFLDRLYRGKKKATGTLHLFVDEASTFAPQSVRGDVAKMVGAAENISRRGRLKGLGSSWIDQRTASLNWDVLSQAGGVLIFGLTGKTDRKAMSDWVKAKGNEELLTQMLAELPGMPIGGGYAWWPALDVFHAVQIRRRRTFDSSAAPEPGEEVETPRSWTAVDLGAVSERMAATIERVKADDPVELRKALDDSRKRIQVLERKLASEPETSREVEVQVEPVEVSVFTDVDLKELRIVQERLAALTKQLDAARQDVGTATALVEEGLESRAESIETFRKNWRQSKSAPAAKPQVSTAAPRKPVGTTKGTSSLPGPQQRVLDAIAWWESVGEATPTKVQAGVIAGYRVSKKVGGTYGNILGRLKAKGLVDYPQQGRVTLTEAGVELAEPVEIERTDEALQAAILDRLSEPERRVLVGAIEAYPDPIHKIDLGAAAGYTVTEKVGGTFGNILGRLRSLGLIDYPQQGYAIATSMLFLEVGR